MSSMVFWERGAGKRGLWSALCTLAWMHGRGLCTPRFTQYDLGQDETFFTIQQHFWSSLPAFDESYMPGTTI